MRRALLLALISLACAATGARAAERYRLEVAPGADSLVADSASFWTRADLQALAARARDRLLLQGRIGAAVRLTLLPGLDGDSVDVARISVERAGSPTRLVPIVRGGEDLVP
ncbi:MAG TPA: hypothetical protein VEU09_10555, partial [Candidatus Binatia bacterium]|nr:hypothetical protein [Candidatus Binatia bacterium]